MGDELRKENTQQVDELRRELEDERAAHREESQRLADTRRRLDAKQAELAAVKTQLIGAQQQLEEKADTDRALRSYRRAYDILLDQATSGLRCSLRRLWERHGVHDLSEPEGSSNFKWHLKELALPERQPPRSNVQKPTGSQQRSNNGVSTPPLTDDEDESG